MTELKSEQIVISSPMSFSGSRQRIWKITKANNVWLKWLVLIPLASILTMIIWCIVLVWYLIFGIFLIPYRLIRRGHRKNKKLEMQHRETLEAVSKSQNRAN